MTWPVALVVIGISLVVLTVALASLRGTQPEERPDILKALAVFVRALMARRR